MTMENMDKLDSLVRNIGTLTHLRDDMEPDQVKILSSVMIKLLKCVEVEADKLQGDK